MELPFLTELLIIFVLSMGVLLASHALRIPTIVGLLITGVVAGPHGLGLIEQAEDVRLLAEVGLILLLFTIGLEFSFESLFRSKRAVFIGGSLQVVLTTAASSFILATFFNVPVNQAIFFGLLVALSSTAIVMRLMQDRAEVDSPHGRVGLSVLIFQDLAIIPIMLLVPFLSTGGTNAVDPPTNTEILAAAGVIAALIVLTKWGIKPILHLVTRTRSRELFMLATVVIGLGVAWLTSSIGLSLVLGAFLAGLIISESEYAHQALGNVLPFRDLFTSFFFISIGMLLDLGFVASNLPLILAIAAAVILLKASIANVVVLILKYPMRTALLVGLSLAQVGEFSFILAETGSQNGLLSEFSYQVFLAVSVFSMAVTPFIVSAAPFLANATTRWERHRTPSEQQTAFSGGDIPEIDFGRYSGHLVIMGFGLNGKNLARAASIADIPYVIIEADPEIVRKFRRKKEPIFWGDVNQEAVLRHVALTEANCVAIAISDAVATRRAVQLCRQVNPHVYIVARTKYVDELTPLMDLGANEIVPEELETSIEIFTRVLKQYKVSESDIEGFIDDVRESSYEMFRSQPPMAKDNLDVAHQFPGLRIITLELSHFSPLVGKTIGEANLRDEYGMSLILIRRGDEVLHTPDSSTVFQVDDVISGVVARTESQLPARD